MKKLPFLFFLFVFLLPSFVFAYDDDTTHPALTDVIVDEYNKRHSDKPITPEQKELIIKGSREEDTPPRWVNHLYDPIQKISWNGEKLGNVSKDVAKTFISWGIDPGNGWTSAFDWVNNREAQERYDRYGGDRTWTRAMEYYANSQLDEAYLTLGHILHLLEDMGVPDHTRNDPHPHSAGVVGETGSPYEQYAKKWTRKTIQQGIGAGAISPASQSSIQEHLDSLALYSNKYFFSKDSINDPAYEFPKIVREDSGFGYGVDEQGGNFPVVAFDSLLDENKKVLKVYYLKNEMPYRQIYDAYFSRLSKQIIAHGVGVIELFHYEASDYIPQHITRMDFGRTPFGGLWSPGVEIAKAGGAVKNFFGSILSGASSLFSKTFGGGRETEEVALDDGDGGGRTSKGGTTSTTSSDDAGDTISYCSFETNQKPRRNSLILSEVAWMGTVRDAREEWLEVQNVSGKPLDVSGFQIIDLKEDIKARFPQGARIGVNGFYILERGEGAVPNVKADILYTGSLSNDGEGVRLYDSGCNLLDEVFEAEPQKPLKLRWPAGNNATKQTMERSSDFSWQTSEKPGGTPRAGNSIPKVSEEEDPSTSSGDIEDEDAKSLDELREDEKSPSATSSRGEVGPPKEVRPLASVSSFQKCSYETSVSPRGGGVRLNEIAWMGTTRDANDEWFEIFNGSGADVDVSGWQVIDSKDQIHITFDAGTKFFSDKYLLFERTDENSVPDVSADFIYTGALANSDEGLRLFDSSCGLIDEALASPLWLAGSNSSKGTMERKDDGSWQTSGVQNGSPRAKNTFIAQSAGGSSSPPPALEPVSEETASSSTDLNHLVISEFQIGSDADAKYEFVELWNPTDAAVDLTGWDLKKKTSGGNLQNLATSITGTIAGKGFFLIASNEYNGSVAPDTRYTQASNTLAGSNNTIVLMNAADETIDEVFYAELAEDASYERKVESGDEYGGHGVDTAGDITDFVLRSTPQPQNTGNFPEPRARPAAPAGVGGAEFAAYDSETLTISFAWERSADYAGATSSISYKVRNLSSSSALLYSGASTSYTYAISEIGTSTLFSLRAYDNEGYGSATTTAQVDTPSFFTSLSFYADPRTGGNRYLLDAYYNSYPFIPDVYNKNLPWGVVVFYLNREPNMSNVFLYNVAPGWEPGDTNSVLRLGYDRCSGGVGTPGASLLLPYDASGCGTGGGLMNMMLLWSALQDTHFLIKTASTTSQISLSPNDYVTAAFYSFFQSSGQTLQIVAVDRTKHYFFTSPPAQAAPTSPANLVASFDENNAVVNISWSGSTDADTLDALIRYQYAFTTSSDFSGALWSSNSALLQTTLDLNLGETYLIGVRAVDDFGNVSSSTEIEYTVPIPAPPLTTSNIRWGYINSTATAEVAFHFDDYATLVPTSRSIVAFYLNSIVPNKGGSYAYNQVLDDGLTKIFVRYPGCADDLTTDDVIFRASSTVSCSGGFGNSYLPSGEGFPPAGEARFTLTGGPYTSNDYITVIFLKINSSYDIRQIGRYVVPVYFTE